MYTAGVTSEGGVRFITNFLQAERSGTAVMECTSVSVRSFSAAEVFPGRQSRSVPDPVGQKGRTMKDYYYARESKSLINEVTGKEELFLCVPIIVTPETQEVNGKPVRPVKIGGVHLPCYYDWIPAGYYLTHKRDLEATAKAEERRNRCWIDNGEGGRIRCPDCRSCVGCPNVGRYDFDNGHDASFDALQENGFDSESGEEVENDFDAADAISTNPETIALRNDRQETLSFAFDIVMKRLYEKKPKYGVIFSELRKGVDKPSDIARNTGLKANRTCEDVPKVMKLAQTMLHEVMLEYHIKL